MTNQNHSGSGDNVAGNKKVNNYVSVSAIWLGVGVLLIALAIWLLPKILPEPIPLTGYVVSNAEVPMDKAKVVVSIPDKESITGYTDENGFFILEKVDLKKVSNFSIEAQFNERKVQASFEGITGDSLPVILQMPAGVPPFKVTYTYMEGYALDFFLENDLRSEIWGSLFTGGSTYVIPNSVTYEAIKGLKKTFGRQKEIYEGTGNDWVSKIAPDGRIVMPKALPGKQERTGDSFDRQFRVPSDDFETLMAMGTWVKEAARNNPQQAISDLSAIVKSRDFDAPELEGAELRRAMALWDKLDGQYIPILGEEWADQIGFLDYEKKIEQDSKEFFDFLIKGQNSSNANTLEFYRQITESGLPKDFLRFRFIQICGGALLLVNVPDLRVKIAIVENISANPINLDSFYIQESKATSLRSLESEVQTLGAMPVVGKKLFPFNTLGAQEKLIIPLAMEFTFREEFRLDDTADDVFVYGPTMDIEEILVGIEKYPFREMDPEVFAFVDGYSVWASCPFVYTKKEVDGPWLLEDHILYLKNKEHLQGFDTLQLQRFTGELQIREIDPETSYIDLVEVLFQPECGPAFVLKPDLKKLCEKDGAQLILNQGDEIVLSFPDYDPAATGIYSVVSYGWYEPYSDKERQELGKKELMR